MSDENIIFMDFSLLFFDRSDVIAGISPYESLFTDSRYDITSVNFNSGKVHEETILSDKIYYNFSQENPKITNVSNPHRRYTHQFLVQHLFSNSSLTVVGHRNEFGDPQWFLHLNIYFLHKQSLKKRLIFPQKYLYAEFY